ncbi:hypothetical protein QVD17_04809 [Tagetes erecta]|uniref:J domain-containing protein n=1 Tax=Tagetes erecta TaxID=13708 RepID=A0AAD8LAU5_TARER|nr:hypothetical protein QVD17_04809 [Tagetes erecta]
MECNKDEAIRAKTISEKKLFDKDYAGSKKFILKAQTLYPGLEGISQMLTILDVYIASENKVNGETDWYGILGANPSDDDETIKKHYRKLALVLHPDKNKSVGADGAFKLLSEAWSLLADKAKRLAYNQRRSTRGFHSKVSFQSRASSPAGNGAHSLAKQATTKQNVRSHTGPGSVVRPPGSAAQPPPPRPPVVSRRTDTFWTICLGCKMHYEYLKLYLNHTLLCPNCRQPFLAKEMPPPSNLPKSTANKQNQISSSHGKYTGAAQNPGPPLPRVNTDPATASKAASVIQQVNDRLKREREEFYSGWPSKKSKSDDESQSSGAKIPYQMSTGNGVPAGTGNLFAFSLSNSVNRSRELNHFEIRHILLKKARTEIHRKLQEWDSMEKSKENEAGETSQIKDEQEREQSAMKVPDPDFHEFDLDRMENSFEDNQVWSAYDDDDGMPRFYALIHKVLSRKPLRVKLSWLNSKTTSEFGSFDWLGCGFHKSLGEFRIGRHEVYKNLNSFSQKVEWKKSPRGTVLIFPRKGQVWALYRNWSRDWNESVPDDVIHKYDMVQVLEDYTEERGVPVSPLIKFTGFRTVFHPHTHQSEVKMIPKEEMFRFSHQVPKYLLTGSEAHNAPQGCLELDPAATPSDLIQESAGTNESS